MNDYVKVWRDEAGEYRWTRYAPNHERISTAGEGYTRRDDAMKAARRVNGDEVEVRWE